MYKDTRILCRFSDIINYQTHKSSLPSNQQGYVVDPNELVDHLYSIDYGRDPKILDET